MRSALIITGILLFPIVILGGLLVGAFEIVGVVDHRKRLAEPAKWTIALVVVGGLAVLGSPSPQTTPTGAAATTRPSGIALIVTSPTSGSTVETNSVTVVGTAPAGSKVVWDVPFRPDHQTVANGGQWSMGVTLNEGINRLTFRLGDDKTTAITLVLTYGPSTAAASATPAGSSTRPPGLSPSAPQATKGPTPSAVIATLLPSPTSKPLATPPVVSLADKTGDMVDENGAPADGPKYQDIISTVVKIEEAGNLVVSIDTAGAAPSSWDPVKTEIIYGFFVETTGDDTPASHPCVSRWPPSDRLIR